MYSYEFGTGEDVDCAFIQPPNHSARNHLLTSVNSLYIQYFKTALLFATETKSKQVELQLEQQLLDVLIRDGANIDAQETQVPGIVHG